MLFSKIKQLTRLGQLKCQWRKKNLNNDTRLVNEFDPDLVSVGSYTYGPIKIVSTGIESKLSIGRFCSIAPEVAFVINNEHEYKCFSTFPFEAKYYGVLQGVCAKSKGGIVVGDDVWIGYRSTILDGVMIGQGSIVAAGSVVTKDILPYSIVGGCPARLIKMRFEKEIIDELIKIDFSLITDDVLHDIRDLLQRELDLSVVKDISKRINIAQREIR